MYAYEFIYIYIYTAMSAFVKFLFHITKIDVRRKCE